MNLVESIALLSRDITNVLDGMIAVLIVAAIFIGLTFASMWRGQR